MNYVRYAYLFFICLFGCLKAAQLIRDHTHIGIDDNGKGVVIFEDKNAGLIMSAVYSGGTWSTSTTISTAGMASYFPYLVFDVNSGYAMAVWLSSDTTNGAYLLYGSVYVPGTGTGTGWSKTPFQITSNNVSVIPDSINLSINHEGGINTGLATWRQFDNGNIEIGVATGTVTNGWSSGSTVS